MPKFLGKFTRPGPGYVTILVMTVKSTQIIMDDDSIAHCPAAFVEPRHSETIEGENVQAETWRMKERMKTVSVALVMCLNIGVDPPDVVKVNIHVYDIHFIV